MDSKHNCLFVVLLFISWESTPALSLGRKCVGRSGDFLKNANTHFFPTQYIQCNCKKSLTVFGKNLSIYKSIFLFPLFQHRKEAGQTNIWSINKQMSFSGRSGLKKKKKLIHFRSNFLWTNVQKKDSHCDPYAVSFLLSTYDLRED